MAYDQGLAQRIRELLGQQVEFTERQMFGGLAFMVSGNMCVGVLKDQLVLRVGPQHYPDLLKMPGTSEMDFTGRSLKGFLYISPDYLAEDHELKKWLSYAIMFVTQLPAK